MDDSYYHLIKHVFDNTSEQANSLIGETQYEKSNRVVKKDGGYKCIHLNVMTFIEELNFIIKHFNWTPKQIRKLTFLDIGCGVGQKVYLAGVFGFNAYGLELRQPLIDAGKSLFSELSNWEARDRLIQGNALEFSNYNNYDILYFYCPLFNHELETKMEQRIVDTVTKSGTIVIANLSMLFGQIKVPGWKVIKRFNSHSAIFQKI